MKKYESLFGYVGVAAIVLLLFGLAGWYVFLRQETSGIESADAARGFSIGIPSFLGSRGSTSFNSGGGGAIAAETGAADSSSAGSAFRRFLGIGQPAGTGERASFVPGGTPASEEATEKRRTPRFWRVSLTPVAGLAFTHGSTTRLRYVERATGYIFDVDPETGDVTRVTNTLLPKIYDASIGADDRVVLRTIDGVRAVTLGGKVGSTTDGVSQLDTVSLGNNVRDATAVPSSRDILIVTRESNGEHLIRAAWNGSGAREIAHMPAGEFHALFASETKIVLAEKAASGIESSAFRVGDRLTPLLRDIPGLSVRLDPLSDALVYSSDTGGQVTLFARPHNASEVTLPIRTLAEKCVFKPGGEEIFCGVPSEATGLNFLDRWYRGETHTSDVLYRATLASASAERLFTIDSGQAVDVEQIVIDPSGEYLAFLNARDKSLWMFRVRSD